MLSLHAYNFAGKDKPADYYSMHPMSETATNHINTNKAETYVNLLLSYVISKALSLQQIKAATNANPCFHDSNGKAS